MLNSETRINAFANLGLVLDAIVEEKQISLFEKIQKQHVDKINELISDSILYNAWFTENNVRAMLKSIVNSLEKVKLDQWIKPYLEKLDEVKSPKNIAVIMAGNIPAVGFHDFLTVLVSGNSILAKLSGDDNKLLPAITNLLLDIEPEFNEMIQFQDGKLSGFNAVIATGSNNTSRYFDYYFGKYPNVIRKNRNAIAILTGDETQEHLDSLCDDIFQYYGLGCRNVSKLLVPSNYDFTFLLDTVSKRTAINENHKYFNNYEYNKAIYLINATPHYDAGNLMLLEDKRISSPVSVIYYEYYQDETTMLQYLKENKDSLQCIVSNNDNIDKRVGFGQSQQPELWDYADGVDTMKFLLSLENQ